MLRVRRPVVAEGHTQLGAQATDRCPINVRRGLFSPVVLVERCLQDCFRFGLSALKAQHMRRQSTEGEDAQQRGERELKSAIHLTLFLRLSPTRPLDRAGAAGQSESRKPCKVVQLVVYGDCVRAGSVVVYHILGRGIFRPSRLLGVSHRSASYEDFIWSWSGRRNRHHLNFRLWQPRPRATQLGAVGIAVGKVHKSFDRRGAAMATDALDPAIYLASRLRLVVVTIPTRPSKLFKVVASTSVRRAKINR